MYHDNMMIHCKGGGKMLRVTHHFLRLIDHRHQRRKSKTARPNGVILRLCGPTLWILKETTACSHSNRRFLGSV